MFRKLITQPRMIIAILVLQFIPLIIFPKESFAPTSQEWWLPVVLAFLSLWAVFGLIVRRTILVWPWYLISFAQGFNIISRLMMFMPHATTIVNNVLVSNTAYIALSLISMLLSVFVLWYVELPEVRLGLIRKQTA
ncbi:MAG TPA: hypothetical protein VHO48_04260 [Anaerolineaceae bacterium]|nr:hypothetical protein [Anaerolineaceae bacterium]